MGCQQSTPAKYADNVPADVSALQNQVIELKKQLAAKEAQGQKTPMTAPASSNDTVECLFFPDGALPCRNAQKPGGCKRPNCTFAHNRTSLVRFLEVLNSARTTLDICVFTITCDDIADAVIALHKKRVRVRIITDNDQAHTQGSDVARLRQAGIEVRQDSAPTHMHHKFCIIDGRIVMSGSFNWTRQAVIGNQENVVISAHPKLKTSFHEQFEKLWAQFKP